MLGRCSTLAWHANYSITGVRNLVNHILVFVMLAASIKLSAAAPDEKWYMGSVQLSSSKIVQGKVAIKPDHNVVLFRVGEETMVFPAHKVMAVRIYDEDELTVRNFVTLHLELGAQSVYKFYEVLVDGKVSILRRQQVGWQGIHIEIMDYDYFVWHEGKLMELFKFKKKVYPQMVEHSDGTIKTYVRANHLSLSRLEHLIKIAAYYNKQLDFETLAKN